MKRIQLKQLIREMIDEANLSENQKYNWKDGTSIEVGYNGKPTEPGWTSLGYANGWTTDMQSEIDKLKGKKSYSVSLSMHHEAVYYPEVKMWYEVDSSG